MEEERGGGDGGREGKWRWRKRGEVEMEEERGGGDGGKEDKWKKKKKEVQHGKDGLKVGMASC